MTPSALHASAVHPSVVLASAVAERGSGSWRKSVAVPDSGPRRWRDHVPDDASVDRRSGGEADSGRVGDIGFERGSDHIARLQASLDRAVDAALNRVGDVALEPALDAALDAASAVHGPMSFQILDAWLAVLCGHADSVESRVLDLIAECDLHDLWIGQGFLSCAHYVSWRCGVTLGPAREKLRTARALRQMPLVREQFRAGRLSYSKVRALTRLDPPHDPPHDESWLLEFALRHTAGQIEQFVRRRLQAQAAADPARLFDSRSCHYAWNDQGMLAVSVLMTPEQGAVFLKALGRGVADVGPAERESSDAQRAAVRCDGFVRLCERALEQADGTLGVGGHVADRFMVHVDVAAETLLSNATDRVEPKNLAKLEDGGPPLSMATLRRLSCDARSVLHHRTRPAHGTANGSENTPNEGPKNEPSTEPVSRRTRTIPTSLRRKVRQRDGGCRFPGCSQSRFVDVHHVRPWTDGGPTTFDNLITLCRGHHTLVHECDYRIESVGDAGFRFCNARGDSLEDGEWHFR